MFLQGRVIIVWLSWLIGGICDEQYLKNTYTIKEDHGYSHQDYSRIKQAEVQVQRHSRPASYAGDAEWRRARDAHPTHPTHPTHPAHPTHPTHTIHPTHPAPATAHCYVNRVPEREHVSAQYASSSMLDEIGGGVNVDALKTRSLPAFLRPKPRPLSTEDDLQQLYAKVSLSKKHKNRMRSEHAAIIALSKSHSQFFDADAVIVYDQRTAL
ncbi:PREDICTED: uncharacterized protein LOC106101332 isoform X2 [Papilio polytes]|uniref:uncharacterized protein LOC106101332 isoform X2 n=1 Tax=Papilio polytes TaxID=76194 RepID=UPI00067652D7|nr:PREDICTED: uncharacterized protein LOC106101332 isoform X2 [Papilio polytes]